MAEHIEVVIKIPKYYLTHPQDYSCLAECVRRGVPLPKEHGRLIDADDFFRMFGELDIEPYTNAQTIIEADTEGSDSE